MDIVGGGSVHVFAPADEKPHTPGMEENWQESFVLYWCDMKQSVGGFFRLGHEPNYQGGQTQFNIGIVCPEGIYRRCTNLPLRPEDRLDNGFINGDDTLRYEFDGTRILWTLKDKEVEARLTVELYVPAIDAHRRKGVDTAERILSAHVDAACGVTGTMTIKGKSYQIDALAVRDHAWGTRDMKSLLSYRWTLATFDKENSFVAMTFLSTANKMAKFGWVIRGDKVIMAEKIATRAIVGDDGATSFGGVTHMTLTTGEVFEAKFEPLYPSVASWIYFLHPGFYHDSLCRVTWNGKVGFGVFESGNNIQGGTLRPKVFDGSIGPDPGWHMVRFPGST